MNECIRCHTPLPVDGRFCSNCGTPSGEIAHVCPPDPTNELKERLERTLAGRYQIIKLLGRGGMAVVFLAQDLALERQVAIKVLPPDMSHDAKLIPRFQQEAKTAAKLDHPNIIPIYRVESEGGLDYFVMKYVTGHSLDQLLEQGPLPVDQARRVLREAALALGHAHKRGIVHRDVKPANIMLEADGRVVLTDFGISKALEGATALTGTGTIIGTPHYMAPEQAKGHEVDGRADQYALAIVGHQILTGKQPFDGSSHSILYKHVFEPAPRIFDTRPDAPADLCAALDRAMNKEPEKRFANMEEFATAVSGDRTGPRTAVTAPVKPVTKGTTIPTHPVRSGKLLSSLGRTPGAERINPSGDRASSRDPGRDTAQLPERDATGPVRHGRAAARCHLQTQVCQEGVCPADGGLRAVGDTLHRERRDRAHSSGRLPACSRVLPASDRAGGISH
jgi:serine/threonine protein kinase